MQSATIGTVSKEFSETRQSLLRLAATVGVEVDQEKKAALAGPNDYIEILLSSAFWIAAVPWALTHLGSGAMGFIGAQLANRLYVTNSERKLTELEQQVREGRIELREQLDDLMETLRLEARNDDWIRLGMRTSDNRLARADVALDITPSWRDELTRQRIAESFLTVACMAEAVDDEIRTDGRNPSGGRISVNGSNIEAVLTYTENEPREQTILSMDEIGQITRDRKPYP